MPFSAHSGPCQAALCRPRRGAVWLLLCADVPLVRHDTHGDRLATSEKGEGALRANEQATRNAENEKIDKEWTEYAAPFKAAHKRPPMKNPHISSEQRLPNGSRTFCE